MTKYLTTWNGEPYGTYMKGKYSHLRQIDFLPGIGRTWYLECDNCGWRGTDFTRHSVCNGNKEGIVIAELNFSYKP